MKKKKKSPGWSEALKHHLVIVGTILCISLEGMYFLQLEKQLSLKHLPPLATVERDENVLRMKMH